MGPLILLVFLVLWILLCWSLCVICWSPWFWCIFYLFCIFFKRSWGFLISECWVCLIIGFDSFIYSFKGLVFVAAAFSVDVHVVELLYMVTAAIKFYVMAVVTAFWSLWHARWKSILDFSHVFSFFICYHSHISWINIAVLASPTYRSEYCLTSFSLPATHTCAFSRFFD